jgi:hypothetical protein
MQKGRAIPKKNDFPKVVKSPTPANRKMNSYPKVVTSPTPANRSMNKPAKVSPKS